MISDLPYTFIYQVKHSVDANQVICLLFHLSYPFIRESNACPFTQPATELNCILPLRSLPSFASMPGL